MIKNTEDILRMIGEGPLREFCVNNLELKSSWKQDVGQKISGFANSVLDGSIWLCVGIDDDGTPCGHDESWAKQTEETISQHLNQYLDPQITCSSVACHSVNGAWFVTIRYENPGAVVYWNRKAYKGVGTTILEMTPAEVMQLTVSLPGLTDFTAQPYATELDDSMVARFGELVSQAKQNVPINDISGLTSDELLHRLGINGTQASHILFGPCAYRVVQYDSEGVPVRNETRAGLFGLLDEPFRLEIQNWTRQFVDTTSQPYPENALKEALANAVAHAAHVERSGDVIIEMFPDRVCISNLCMPESAFFANKWFSRAHNTVNRTLMEVLRMAGFVDELGRGKNLIFAESLRNGKLPPEVAIESGGRYDRWRLFLYGGTQNVIQLRLLERIREIYPDGQKALIANALVLWRGRSVTDIRKYVDGESSALFADVLTDLHGPIFYYQERDSIIPRRWVRVLLGEGKDSKQLSPGEEKELLDFARKIQTEFHHGYLTPKQLRDLAGMGESPAEKVQTSRLLRKWTQEGAVTSVRKGLYVFVEQKKAPTVEDIRNAILEELRNTLQLPGME